MDLVLLSASDKTPVPFKSEAELNPLNIKVFPSAAETVNKPLMQPNISIIQRMKLIALFIVKPPC